MDGELMKVLLIGEGLSAWEGEEGCRRGVCRRKECGMSMVKPSILVFCFMEMGGRL